MPLVTAPLRGRIRGRRPRRFDEQIDWCRTPEHFYSKGSEATADLQSKRRTVKAGGLLEIINIEINEKIYDAPSLS
jgi:hypothetical protein